MVQKPKGYEKLTSCEDGTYVASTKTKSVNLEELSYLSGSVRTFFYVLIIGLAFCVFLFYQTSIPHETTQATFVIGEEDPPTPEDEKYLIFNKKCRIANVEPYNLEVNPFVKLEKYTSCTKKKLLTYTTVINGSAYLNINDKRRSEYSKENIRCCYSEVTRDGKASSPDCCIKLSSCKPFNKTVALDNPTVMVTCTAGSKKTEIYKNAHSAITIPDSIQKQLDSINKTKQHLSVLFIGIDSVSRLNFIRSLPKTRSFMVANEWIELKGYNKIGDNTFPNLMAIFTGKNESTAYKTCNPKVVGPLDKCNFIWNDFKRNGYITAYGEDSGSINTFNYEKKGFKKLPTDYYFRPYILASEKLKIVRKETLPYCTGPESSGERILNLAKKFSTTFKGYPTFSFFWTNSFSHNAVNTVSGMDEKLAQFFEEITMEGINDNSIIIFLSDHGMRFGEIRRTNTGWYEERLPFIYISLPPWFKHEHSDQYEALKKNAYRLTNPYDLHMTLQDILVISDYNHTVVPSSACSNCSSLFGLIEKDRSCEDASIDSHWCTCKPFQEVQSNDPLVNKTINFILDYIHKDVLHNNSMCANFSMKKVIYAKMANEKFINNSTTVIAAFQTEPEAYFEATVKVKTHGNKTSYDFDGNISRLDSYAPHSSCINDAVLKKYCHCR